MQHYRQIANQIGTPEAQDLAEKLASWHDAMVTHERRLKKLGAAEAGCGPQDYCPHAEAGDLWRKATIVFGAAAQDLVFLRSRAGSAVDGKGGAAAGGSLQ
jgi:hypothetical protein